jgi:hypothetical protein
MNDYVSKHFDTLKTDVKDAYAEGKISEQHYNNLKDETSILYERAYKKKIDSLNGKVDGENNRIKWDEIKNDITDAYAEGKITELTILLINESIREVLSKTDQRAMVESALGPMA